MKLIGVLGGTFDPVHMGHMRLAVESIENLGLDHIRLIPVGTPNHRAQPFADASVRLAMLERAADSLAGKSPAIVDPRELVRTGVSYMVDTLDSLKKDFPDDALCLILGFDAFARLTSWHRWQALFDYSHIVIATRPQAGLVGGEAVTDIGDETLRNFVRDKILHSPKELNNASHGKILFMEIPLLEISSTDIRRRRRESLDISHLVPLGVQEIIENESLYRKPD